MNALLLGGRRYDLTTRPLVMGVLGATRDPGSHEGGHGALDALLRRASTVVAEGADLLDMGRAVVGPEGEAEELKRVVPAVEAVAARFDLPLSVETGRAGVLDAACAAGAVCGASPSGPVDRAYLATAARHRAAVIVAEDRAEPALEAGIPPESVILDAGAIHLGNPPAGQAALLSHIPRLATLGHPVLLAAVAGGPPAGLSEPVVDARRWSSLAAIAWAVGRGVRVVRVSDVAGTVRVVRILHALFEPGS